MGDGAHVLAISLLPGLGPVSLGELLGRGEPTDVWAAILAGRIRRPPARATAGRRPVEWHDAARRLDVAALWEHTCAAGIGVTWLGRPDYPRRLESDPLPPPVLFWRGSLRALDAPCVALVGTRSATPEGRATAREMGRDLAAAGVCVVSGLALGIDGAAHRGALEAGRPEGTVGVAASGVDRPYPLRHRELWERVVGAGAVISETPPGRPAQTWRFPARNRIIAGLVSMVVVVESHAAGGSLITAEAALERGVEVRAVPGPVRSPASAGTNQLLYDGPGPVRDAEDILVALGTAVPVMARDPTAVRVMAHGAATAVPVMARDPTAVPVGRPGPPAPGRTARAQAAAGVTDLVDVMGWEPRSLNWVVERSGRPFRVVAVELEALVAGGSVVEEHGWFQRIGPVAR